ncbi:MAG: hypothetical protein DRN66_00080 [Candidatus Nanohalarchaeota archaeon]|nr:MAG: hypothetical protein DRN66_00080 [Candidatus Nanohaloarchaeota archaeon]
MFAGLISALNDLNINVLFFLNQFNSGTMVFVSYIVYLFIIAVLFLSYKKGGKYFLLNLFWAGVLYVFVEGMKQVSNIARPHFSIASLTILSDVSSSMSFPSRHAVFAFFLLCIIPSLIEKRKDAKYIYFTAALAAVFISLSRTILGVHYPSDVLAGAAIGYIFGKMALLFGPDSFSFNYRELKRQIIHFSLGIFILFIMLNFTRAESIVFGFFLMASCLAVEFVYNRKIFPLHLLVNEVKRKKESPVAGALYFLIGSMISLIIFPKTIALICILLLAVGDSFATVFGTHFKTRKLSFPPDKSIGGTVACFLFNFIALLLFFAYNKIYGMKIVLFLFLCALIGTMAELAEIKVKGRRINDNITLPIISGIFVWGIYLLFGFA